MPKGLYVPHDPSEPVEVREFASIEDYQEAVQGWIDPVRIDDLNVVVYVNDEGLLQHMPFNSRVTFLLWYHVRSTFNELRLVGDAVIVGQGDDGDVADVPERVVSLLTGTGGFAVLVRIEDQEAMLGFRGSYPAGTVLPLAQGDPTWFVSQARYETYGEASVWALVLSERWSASAEIRVVPIAELRANPADNS